LFGKSISGTSGTQSLFAGRAPVTAAFGQRCVLGSSPGEQSQPVTSPVHIHFHVTPKATLTQGKMINQGHNYSIAITRCSTQGRTCLCNPWKEKQPAPCFAWATVQPLTPCSIAPRSSAPCSPGNTCRKCLTAIGTQHNRVGLPQLTLRTEMRRRK